MAWPITAAAQRSVVRDSAEGAFTIPAARSAATTKVMVSVKQRRLWVIDAGDTLRTAPVSVSSGRTLSYAGRSWKFATPRGVLKVRAKRTDPVWRPPDWHYAEVAGNHHLKLVRLTAGHTLRNGSRLVIRDSVVGVILRGEKRFHALPIEEHIVFDSTLFIPPTETHNRQLHGELGDYALDLGDGYMLHGTGDQSSIGSNTTHGCIRLAADDLTWLYENVPVGATVVVR